MKKPSAGRVAAMLVTAAVLLLISIMLGTQMGNRILVNAGGSDSDTAELPTPVPISVPTISAADRSWKHVQIVSVATDPGFPDPRVTPTPTPSPTTRPSPRPEAKPRQANKARPRPTPSPDEDM